MKVLLVDNDDDRRPAWAEALERTEVNATVCAVFPDELDGYLGKFDLWLVHAGNLPSDSLGDPVKTALDGGIPVCVFSGGGLTLVGDDRERRFRDDKNRERPLAEGLIPVRCALDEDDAERIARAAAGWDPASDLRKFVTAVEGGRWPEHLVALYIVCLALREFRNRPEAAATLLNHGWADLIESAKQEATSQVLGKLTFLDLAADNAEKAAREIHACLEKVNV